MIRQWVFVVVVAVLLAAAMFTLGYLAGSWQPPQCAWSEDTCRPVYEDDRWRLEVVIP